MRNVNIIQAGAIALFAAFADYNAKANTIDVSNNTTIIDFATLFSSTDPVIIIQQDKRWSDFTASANFASLSGGQFSLISLQPDEDLHTFVAQGPTGLRVGTYTISYSISVIQPSPVKFVDSSTGLDINLGTGTLKETFSTGENLMTNGMSVSTSLPSVMYEHVTDTLYITSPASFISFSNSFLQSNELTPVSEAPSSEPEISIPEPPTFAILSFGIVTMGLNRYRGWDRDGLRVRLESV